MSWWEKEVALLEQRLKNRKEGQPILFETGYGPSGLPHLGTFAEVARTSFVRWAFQQQHPEIPSELIAFSDDMDGLRSVPENLPNKELLTEHLGRPLSQIPDPFGEAESFSAHMIGKLKSFLNDFGFECTFMSSSDCYTSGQFDEGLLLLLQNEEKIKNIVLPTLQPETRKTWSPFLPICESCGRYTTRVTEIHPEEGELSYACELEFGGAAPCGHTARTSIKGGRVKVGWKIDWALRWMMLGIDYEMFGKDLIESADISRKICRALGQMAPVGSFYELFLDEEGRKISKKIGNGISMDEWREYAHDDALLYFLTKPPRKARRIGRALVGQTNDEYIKLLKANEEQTAMKDMLQSCAPNTSRNHQWSWTSGFDFSLLVGLVSALGIDDKSTVVSFLEENETIGLEKEDAVFASELVVSALAYQRQVLADQRKELDVEALSSQERKAISTFTSAIEKADFDDPVGLQNLTYEIGKTHELELRPWFTTLYIALTGNAAGPRLGTLLAMLGREKSLEKLRVIG
jgi:lysyl-tRNA synthetase class 1